MSRSRWCGLWPTAISFVTKRRYDASTTRLSSTITSSARSLHSQNDIQTATTSSGKGAWRAIHPLWTEEELKLLAECRLRGMSVTTIQRMHFPHRSMNSLYQRTSFLDKPPRKPQPRAWTSDDTERVLELYDQGRTAEDIAQLFPGRTRRAIQHRIYSLRARRPEGVRYKRIFRCPISDQLMDSIRLLCADGKTVTEIANAMNISYATVRRKCKIMGLHVSGDRPRRMIPWTADDLACLEPFLAKDLSGERAFELFPSRSREAVSAKLHKMRVAANVHTQSIRRWTSKETEVLLPYIMQKHLPLAGLAKKLNRTEQSICNKIVKLRQAQIDTGITNGVRSQGTQDQKK